MVGSGAISAICGGAVGGRGRILGHQIGREPGRRQRDDDEDQLRLDRTPAPFRLFPQPAEMAVFDLGHDIAQRLGTQRVHCAPLRPPPLDLGKGSDLAFGARCVRWRLWVHRCGDSLDAAEQSVLA